MPRQFLIRAAICLLASTLVAQPQTGTLRGTIRDSHGHPLDNVSISLQLKNATTITTRSAQDGTYRFLALSAGTYTLHAEMPGFSPTSFDPLPITPDETKTIDLTLGPVTQSIPEFSEEPQFTVAGVTAAPNPGGHGSDTVMRASDKLAKETAALGATKPEKANADETTLREDVAHEPDAFDSNFALGKFLVDDGRTQEALPLLVKAATLPADDQHLAALHNLLGGVQEKLGKPLDAVRSYQRAAELDPSEPNLFAWGADLLLHRALDPAIDVFTRANHLFPQSARILVGLGVANYAKGSYDQAVQTLCAASDLNPAELTPYLFLGKMREAEIGHRQDIADHLERFARLYPGNALANYYYAMNLWSQKKTQMNSSLAPQIKTLLEKSIQLDPKLAPAYLQLGILYSEQNDFHKAIDTYRRAIAVDPSLEAAHYRLAQAYRRVGENSKAKAELRLYEQAAKKNAEDTERERREIQQFVYTLQTSPTPQ